MLHVAVLVWARSGRGQAPQVWVRRQPANAIPTANTTSAPVAGSAAEAASWENPVRAVRTPTATKPTPATAAIQPSLRPGRRPRRGRAQAEQGEPVDEVEEGAEPFSTERTDSATR